MAYTLWSQDIFTRGELSPFMYARATVTEYGNGLKTAENVLTYPAGAAGKRFGTLYKAQLSNINFYNEFFLETFQYLNECVYQLVFTNLNIAIFLEGILVANVTTTLTASQVYNSDFTVIGSAFRLTGQGFKPFDLTRSASAGNVIASVNTDFFTLTNPITPGLVLPVRFTTTGTLPTTLPQIMAGITYFANNTTATDIEIYPDAKSAAARDFTKRISITAGTGTGTNTAIVQNTWTFALAVFKNRPVYDFNGVTTSYDALTFTPSAVTGTGVTITVSGAGYAPLNSSYVGGAFIGGGGSARITAVASPTSFTVSVQTPFTATTPIQGSLSFLGEPAWSDARGWPQVCSSYQNRALFANTASLPNGFWASVINDYTDFGDLTSDDDDAISWYPTSDNMNFIRFIVPYRSITVHTNTGIYSSPLSDVVAITPSNFTLQLQDSTPADVLQPQQIDNQVIVISGNDVHQMLWDGINNAYTSDIVSIINEQTIRDPRDEIAFIDTSRAGSRFVFIINANGTMATYQTLLSQNVSGITIQKLEQSYGNASFLQAASSSDGRCWFVNQREIATQQSPIAITGFTSTTLHAIASNFSATLPTAITFTTAGSLPAASPLLQLNHFYWAIGVDADNFEVYLTQDDAVNATNPVTFTSAGVASNVVQWPLATIFTLEELTKEVFLDCAVKYSGVATSTIATGVLFNAQDVKMVGDGFGFESPAEDNAGDEIDFIAHGQPVAVSDAYIGFPIVTVIEPMPLSISNGNSAKQTTLTKPKNVEWVRFMFNNTIGGTINGIPIVLNRFNESLPGDPPLPARGIFEMSIFNGWDDFSNPSYTIIHDDPFDIQLLGVFYSVEI